MDLKIDFSELIDKIRELIGNNVPTCKVEIILEDGSISFDEMYIKYNVIPFVGDTFYAQPTRYSYNSNSTKVKVLHREISYYGSDADGVILTVEKV